MSVGKGTRSLPLSVLWSQVDALVVDHVCDRVEHCFLRPQVSTAASGCPWAAALDPHTGLPHPPRSVCFQHRQDTFWLGAGSDHHVHMVCPHVQGMQRPFPDPARFADRRIHRCSATIIEMHWCKLKLAGVVVVPSRVRWDQRVLIVVVVTVHRAPLISVKPGSVATKRDEISERSSEHGELKARLGPNAVQNPER